MIWSIIPESVIFATETDAAAEPLRIVEYQGCRLVVRSHQQGEAEIVSLLSTDPADYLKSNFAPGSLIDIKGQA